MGTILGLAALLAALAAIFYTWRLQRELDKAAGRLDRYNRALFQANEETRRLREQLAEDNARWHVELLRRTGGEFTPDLKVREAVMLHPQAQQVLAAFHLGGCSQCGVDPDATLQQVSGDNSIDVNKLLASLNQLQVAGHGGAAPSFAKTPNVQLEF